MVGISAGPKHSCHRLFCSERSLAPRGENYTVSLSLKCLFWGVYFRHRNIGGLLAKVHASSVFDTLDPKGAATRSSLCMFYVAYNF